MERITIHPVISVDTIPCEPDLNLIKVTTIFDISTSQTAAIPSTSQFVWVCEAPLKGHFFRPPVQGWAREATCGKCCRVHSNLTSTFIAVVVRAPKLRKHIDYKRTKSLGTEGKIIYRWDIRMFKEVTAERTEVHMQQRRKDKKKNAVSFPPKITSNR